MKKFLYMAVAAIAALSSCTNDDLFSGEKGNNANAPVFTATIESDATSRTTLAEGSAEGNKKVNWESTDEVMVCFLNAAAAQKEEGTPVYCLNVYQPKPLESDASIATLSIKDGEVYNPEAPVLAEAFYPASLIDKTTYQITFPAIQEYKGDDKIGFAPMIFLNHDFFDNNDETMPSSLTFKNTTALLKITVPYTEMTSVHSITVSSNVKMNGTGVVFIDDALCFQNTVFEAGENLITLDCYSLNGSNVDIPEGGSKTFYVSIPILYNLTSLPRLMPYDYLQILVTDGTNTKYMRTNKAGIEVKRNKIYPITFAENYTPTSKLNIKVTSDDIATVKKIKVVTDKNIVGESKEKVLDIPAAQQTPSADGTVYSIEIPSQTYAFYQIYLSEDGTTYKEAMASKATGGISITTDIDIDYEKNAVQLWANGPYFATENVGCQTWGYIKDKWPPNYEGTDYEKDALGNDIIPAAYDVATYEWGSAWRMPTKGEFSALIDGRDISYKTSEPHGFNIVGDYGSIFLPVDTGGESAWYYGICRYWSATPYEEESAYYLKIDFTDDIHATIEPDNEDEEYSLRANNYLVRAVLR